MHQNEAFKASEEWKKEMLRRAKSALRDCETCDGYILAASEAPYCPTCARLKREGKDL